jgi:hypothetical protein
MDPDDASRPTASPWEVAVLAALLDGPACRSGDSREALLRALALFEESAALAAEFGPLPLAERVQWLAERLRPGPGGDGPRRLLSALQRSASAAAAPEEAYFLALTGETGDTLRAHLAAHCNLAGRRGSKYIQAETVLRHLRDWMAQSGGATNGHTARETYEKFLANHAARNERGQLTGYSIPKVTIDLFVAWRLAARTYRFASQDAQPAKKKKSESSK